MKKGKVYLVGAGPGDIGLTTLKAVECLKAADVVVHDRLANPELLSFLPRKARIVFAGKHAHHHVLMQNEINRLLVAEARAGNTVVRLKGGDPFVFGRGAEEALVLARAGIPFEIVPGVSSAHAAAAYAGIPVTCRNISSRLHIVTGHLDDGTAGDLSWTTLADAGSTLVILMGMTNLENIMAALAKNPAAVKLPVAVVSNGTRPTQRVVTGTVADILIKVREAGIKAPAVIIVGKVVAMRRDLDWFRSVLPLSGKNVLVTRPQHQAPDTVQALQAQGARVTALALIRIIPANDNARSRKCFENIGSYTWIVISSVNGAELFLAAMARHAVAALNLRHVQFAAVGSKTAEYLEKSGIVPALVPEKFVQESLARDMISRMRKTGTIKTARVLLAGSADSRPVLEKKLQAAGVGVDTLELYRTAPVLRNQMKVKELIKSRWFDAVLLTSAACADSLADALGRGSRMTGVTLATIGPVTSRAARQRGLTVDVQAKEFTVDGLVAALAEYYSKTGAA